MEAWLTTLVLLLFILRPPLLLSNRRACPPPILPPPTLIEFSSPDSINSEIPSDSDRNNPKTPPEANLTDNEWLFSQDGNLVNSQAGIKFEIAEEILKLQISTSDKRAIAAKSNLIPTAPPWQPTASYAISEPRSASVQTDITIVPTHVYKQTPSFNDYTPEPDNSFPFTGL